MAVPADQMRGRGLIRYVRDVRARRCGSPARWIRLAAIMTLLPLLNGCAMLGGLSNSTLASPQSMTVSSPVFGAKVQLPSIYTCHGPGLSPPLQWSGATRPAAKSFAIVMDDSQAPIAPYVYWVVFDISPTTVAIGQNQLPTGAKQADNSAGKASYDPPCPQKSSRQYRFTVYALNAVIKLRNGAGLRAAWSAIANHVIAAGRLTTAPIRNRSVT